MLVSTKPLLYTDGGVVTLKAGAPVELTLSETMDSRSLYGGIVLWGEEKAIPLVITVPPPGPLNVSGNDTSYKVTVAAQTPGDLEVGPTYALDLRTSLLDQHGDALREAVRLLFAVTP